MYIIDYILAQMDRERREMSYRYYVTDALQNALKWIYGADVARWKDIVDDMDNTEPEETSEQIKEKMIKKFKKMGGVENEST